MTVARWTLLLSLACLPACTNVVQRPGVTSENGTFVRYVTASPAKVGMAAEAALKSMGYMIVHSGPDGDGYVVTSRDAQDNHVTATAVPTGDGATKVGVNVDPGNNEGLSLNVLDKIQARLGS